LARQLTECAIERFLSLPDHDQTAKQTTSKAPSVRSNKPLFAQEVLASYPIHQHRCLLDVGGGEGVFLAAAATRAPALRLMLFDLPAVAERARARLTDACDHERALAVQGRRLRGN
jgi:demethylspheroidene O-methyltransferase